MLSSSRTHCYRNNNNNSSSSNNLIIMKQEQEKGEVVVDEKKEDYTTNNVHDSVFDWGHNACCLSNSDYMVVPEDESIKMMQLERSMVNILATSATATTITSSAVTAAARSNNSSSAVINDDYNEKEQYNNNNNFNNAVDNDSNEYFDGDNENNNDDDINNNNDDDDDVDLLKNYPRFKKKELLIGKVLGSGTFGVVHEIRGFELRDDEDLNKDSSEGTKRRLSAIKTILLKKSSSSRINRRGSPDSLPTLTRTKSQGNSSSRRGSWGQVLLRRGNSYKSHHYDENNAQSNSSNETMLGEFSGHSEDNNDDDDDATDNCKCKSERSEEEEEEHHHREFIAKHCIRQTDSHKGHARYAIKSLKPELVNSTRGSDESNLLDQGMQDMEIETRFLSRLQHPNIIKMRAFANVKPDHKNYFIVMDRLYDTLEQRIKKWSKQRDTILQLQPIKASSLIRQKGNGRSSRRHHHRGSGSAGSNSSRVNINAIGSNGDNNNGRSSIRSTVGGRRHSNDEVDADSRSTNGNSCSNNNNNNNNNERRESEEKELLVERLNVAYDISSALFYLHSNNIIHRDLKPNNIGFDCRGDVKIFDFGLAKDIDEKNLVDTSNNNNNENDDNNDDNSGYNFNFNDEVDKYNMTGMTGTIRYMSPEVAKCQPYNETCDTYSFIILLWQMLSLQKPYSELRSVDDFKTKVWRNPSREGRQKPYRPQISYDTEQDELLYTKNKIWSTIPTIQILFERGWTNNLEERFHMIVVSNMLKREVESLCDGQLDYRRIINDGGSETEDGAHHQLRRRSTFVYKPKIIKYKS